MALVGHLQKSARGHEYILVVVDFATKFPEAIPLRNMSSKGIAKELFMLFFRVGLPKTIPANQGTREFTVGEKVIVLMPTSELCLLAQWRGPCEVTERVSPVNYLIKQPDRRKKVQLYNINLLNKYHGRELV
jgi:hypothetical protein